MVLSETEFNILVARAMGLSWNHAEQYLRAKGIQISRATYWRIYGKINTQTKNRLSEIAKKATSLHMDRLDKFYTIEAEMWSQYHREDKPFRKVKILESISELQISISALEEACTYATDLGGIIAGSEEDNIFSGFREFLG